MPAGKARITVGAKGTHGCSGYPVVGGEGKVHGCHPTLAEAQNQQAAIYASQAAEAKKSAQATWTGFFYPEMTKASELSNTPTPQVEMDDPSAQMEDCNCGMPNCEKCNSQKGMSIPAPVTIPSDNVETVAIKRDPSTATRERMAESGQAMPDGSFPIANATDLRNAIQSVGRAKNYNAAKQHIMRRARALGLVEMLPNDWRNTASKGLTGWGGSIFDMNPFTK
jgi:hypothetical protein